MTVVANSEISPPDTTDFVEAYMGAIARIVAENVTELLAHLDDDYPNEAVGFLWEDHTVQRLINQARSPERFSISTKQMAERLVERDEDQVIVAFYHSHPGGDCSLSPTDKDSMRLQHREGLAVPWVVVTHEKIRMFWVADDTIHSMTVWTQ